MLFYNSRSYQLLDNHLNKGLETGDFQAWAQFLDAEENAAIDGFINFLNHPKKNAILKKLGFDSINQWLVNVKEWNHKLLDPRNESPSEAMILFQLWVQFINVVSKKIRQSRLVASIPRRGGILFYFGGLSKCLVVKYEIFSDYPTFHIVEVIDNPMSVFDFWGIINSSGVKEKNILKEILSTGHKLIYHRNILLHVDRRKDLGVFGPTIDTVLITEILAQQIFETENHNIKSALEIGCGNGLITVAIANNCKNLDSITAIDIDFNSINCCHRNLRANLNPFLYERLKIVLNYGEFDTDLFKKKFDLIVCNPPYIPFISEDFGRFHNKRDYFNAIGGLSLIEDILTNLSEILAEGGKLLLLVSSMSLDYTLEKLPKQFDYTLAIDDGFEVLFDVEAVINNEAWLKWLSKEKALITRNAVYFHKLFPIWVYYK